MNWIKWGIIWLLFWSSAFAGSIKMNSDLNFEIRPDNLKRGKIEMAIKFFPVEEFRRNELVEFDVEDLSSDSNVEIAFVKGAFIVDRPITDIDLDFFLGAKDIQGIYGAKGIRQIGPRNFRVAVSKLGLSMDFTLTIDFKDDYIMTTERFDRLIDGANSLDSEQPEAAKHQLLTQDRFTRIFKKSVTLNKLIPYGNQTLVISYSLASAKASSIKKIDSIPFVNAHSQLSGQLKDIVKRTHKMMSNK